MASGHPSATIAAMMRQKLAGHGGGNSDINDQSGMTTLQEAINAKNKKTPGNEDDNKNTKKLSHLTKARARGPRRRLPTATVKLESEKNISTMVKPAVNNKAAVLARPSSVIIEPSTRTRPGQADVLTDKKPPARAVTFPQRSPARPSKSLVSQRLALFSGTAVASNNNDNNNNNNNKTQNENDKVADQKNDQLGTTSKALSRPPTQPKPSRASLNRFSLQPATTRTTTTSSSLSLSCNNNNQENNRKNIFERANFADDTIRLSSQSRPLFTTATAAAVGKSPPELKPKSQFLNQVIVRSSIGSNQSSISQKHTAVTPRTDSGITSTTTDVATALVILPKPKPKPKPSKLMTHDGIATVDVNESTNSAALISTPLSTASSNTSQQRDGKSSSSLVAKHAFESITQTDGLAWQVSKPSSLSTGRGVAIDNKIQLISSHARSKSFSISSTFSESNKPVIAPKPKLKPKPNNVLGTVYNSTKTTAFSSLSSSSSSSQLDRVGNSPAVKPKLKVGSFWNTGGVPSLSKLPTTTTTETETSLSGKEKSQGTKRFSLLPSSPSSLSSSHGPVEKDTTPQDKRVVKLDVSDKLKPLTKPKVLLPKSASTKQSAKLFPSQNLTKSAHEEAQASIATKSVRDVISSWEISPGPTKSHASITVTTSVAERASLFS
ncbi:hypothetical protein V1514DRAFT_333430 [Lipomyces japonicus]|uniref:uncharacterized protein n=1 Tax=Lipomyces japonicus TaxID=56871 RepID=UPI0034CDF20B